jgi:hypothetical protein
VKAISRWLEHTLTRDNVRRDKNFARVAAKARDLAEGELLRRLPEELRRCAQDPTLGDDWRVLFHYAVGKLPPHAIWLRRPDGGAIEGKHAYRAIHEQALWVADRRTPLVERLDAAGTPVVDGLPGDPWVQEIRQSWAASQVALADEWWTHAEPVASDSAPAFSAALLDALALLKGAPRAVTLTRVHGACSEQPFALVHALGKPVLKTVAQGSPFIRKAPPTLVLNVAHPDIARLAPLLDSAPRLAAMLVARRMAVAFGALHDDAERTLTGWALT